MDRKLFNNLKSQCKTPSQRRAFNEFIKTFSLDPVVTFTKNYAKLDDNDYEFKSINELHRYLTKNKITSLIPSIIGPGQTKTKVWIYPDYISVTWLEEGDVVGNDYESFKDLVDSKILNTEVQSILVM